MTKANAKIHFDNLVANGNTALAKEVYGKKYPEFLEKTKVEEPKVAKKKKGFKLKA